MDWADQVATHRIKEKTGLDRRGSRRRRGRLVIRGGVEKCMARWGVKGRRRKKGSDERGRR